MGIPSDGSQAVDHYIAEFPLATQRSLKEIRKTLIDCAPEAEEAINYGMPTLRLNGNLVHFAGYKKHIGFYPTPSGIQTFKHELNDFKHSKGAIQLPLDKALPLDLIRRITRFRVDENLSKR